jgi:hypothetical protein
MWAQPKNRPVLGALRQQHRRSPHEARGRSAKRINAKTPAERRRNQAQGTLFFWTYFYFFCLLFLQPVLRTNMTKEAEQADFDLAASVPPGDTPAAYVPASFDAYLVSARKRHAGSRPDTKSKLQSDYDAPAPNSNATL